MAYTFRKEVMGGVTQPDVDHQNHLSQYLYAAWDFSKGDPSTFAFEDITKKVIFTPNYTFDGSFPSNSVEITDEGARISGTYRRYGFSAVLDSFINTAQASLILQAEYDYSETSNNNTDYIFRLTNGGDDRSAFGLSIERYSGKFNFLTTLRDSVQTFSIGSAAGHSHPSAVYTMVVNTSGDNYDIRGYINQELVYHIKGTAALLNNSWRLDDIGLGSTDSNDLLKYSAIYYKDLDTFSETEIEDLISDPYQVFKTKEDALYDNCLKLTTASETLTLPLVGAYDVTATYADDTTANYTGTDTLVLNGTTPVHIKHIKGTDSEGYVYFDGNNDADVTNMPELIQGKHGVLSGFPTPSGYVRDEQGVIDGYALNDASQSINYPLVGAWSGVITYVDGSTANVSGTDTYVITGAAPVQIKSFDTTTSFYDHTTGDADQIIDTVGGNHATIVNTPTSGYLPVVERQVFDANDYANLAGLATAESSNNYQSEYRGATSAGASISGFSDGLRIIDSTITSAITSTISGQFYVDNSTLDDIDVSGATGDTFIVNSEVNDVTG